MLIKNYCDPITTDSGQICQVCKIHVKEIITSEFLCTHEFKVPINTFLENISSTSTLRKSIILRKSEIQKPTNSTLPVN